MVSLSGSVGETNCSQGMQSTAPQPDVILRLELIFLREENCSMQKAKNHLNQKETQLIYKPMSKIGVRIRVAEVGGMIDYEHTFLVVFLGHLSMRCTTTKL